MYDESNLGALPQLPAMQPVVQVFPQRPQCAFDVKRLVSQPLLGFPSQSPKPALHAPIPQTPPVHAPVALAGAHARPHAPQCMVLDCSPVSHPFPALPSQSPKPALQVKPHIPLAHAGAALPAAGQALGEKPCPSPLQTLREVPFAQLVAKLPGVHVHARHAPSTQAFIAGQGVGVYPSPSLLHCLRLVASAQENAPGAHTCDAQAPPLHVVPEAHAVVVAPSPSELQTTRLLPTQVAVPGVQTHPAQVPVVVLQLAPLGHVRSPS